MKIDTPLEQLSRLVKGTLTLDQSFLVKNVTSLDNAGPYDIAVVLERGEAAVFDNISPDKISQSHAGVILAQKELAPGKAYLLVDDPLHALTQLTQFVHQKYYAATTKTLIDKTAHIATGVQLGTGVTIGACAVVSAGCFIGDYAFIGPHTVLGANVSVGASTYIHANVTVEKDCVIGSYSTIHSGVVIGSDGFGYQVTQRALRKIPHIGTVRIGDHVEIGAGCCIDRATFNETVIGNGVKLDNMVHVAHNVLIGPSTAILAQTGIAGGAVIGAGCQIGGQVAIKNHVSIGDRVRIVSKSAVVKDIPAGKTVCGIPTGDFLQWKRRHIALEKVADRYVQLFRKKDVWSKRLGSFVCAWWKKVFGSSR